MKTIAIPEFDESPALDAAIFEGLHSPHQRDDAFVMDRICQNAGSVASVWKYQLQVWVSGVGRKIPKNSMNRVLNPKGSIRSC